VLRPRTISPMCVPLACFSRIGSAETNRIFTRRLPQWRSTGRGISEYLFEQTVVRPPIPRAVARANEIAPQPFARAAHPPDAARGNAGHQCEHWDISRHHGTCGDEGIASDSVAAYDRRIGADGGASLHQSGFEFGLARDERARIDDIGEHTARAA